MTRRQAEKDASERPAVRDSRTKGGTNRVDRARPSDGLTGKTEPRQIEAQLQARLAALEKERDTLAEELKATQQRCRQLEDAAAHVRNRLAWAIDSVESVLQGKG